MYKRKKQRSGSDLPKAGTWVQGPSKAELIAVPADRQNQVLRMEQTDLEPPEWRDTNNTVNTMEPGDTAKQNESKNAKMADGGSIPDKGVHPGDVPKEVDIPAKGNAESNAKSDVNSNPKQGNYELANQIRTVPKPGGRERPDTVLENLPVS